MFDQPVGDLNSKLPLLFVVNYVVTIIMIRRSLFVVFCFFRVIQLGALDRVVENSTLCHWVRFIQVWGTFILHLTAQRPARRSLDPGC